MKHISIAFLIALGLGLIFTSKSQVGEPFVKLNEKEPLLFDSVTSIFVKSKIKEISAKHKEIPLFFVFDGKLFFIKSNTDRIDDSMFVNNTFGIINQNSEVILEQKYDKIYNPNFTISNCVEIAQNGKVGLFNLTNNKIISPQFEYIVPSGNTPSNIAYGLNGNEWYEINSETMQQTPAPNYSPEKFLSELDMDILLLMNISFYYNVNLDYHLIKKEEYSEEIYTKLKLTSLFLEKIIPTKLFYNNKNYYSNEEFYDVENLRDSKITTKNILKNQNLKLYLMNFLEIWTFGRGYVSDKFHVVNVQNNIIHNQSIYNIEHNIYTEDTIIYTKLIDNNKLEVRRFKYQEYVPEDESIDSTLIKNYKFYYTHYPTYNYYEINVNGNIDTLVTNRLFNFTQYVEINDSYFKGDFYRTNEEFIEKKFIKLQNTKDWEGGNEILTKHLELDDLYIMKNEILAEYGLKFKTKYWQDFFGKFNWYKPKHNNIDKLLSKRDKHNIKVIDKTIIKLQKNEWKYTKPVLTNYQAAG